MKNLQVPLLLLILLSFASGCHTGYTVIDRGKMKPVYVHDSEVRHLHRISMYSDNNRRLQALNRAYPTGFNDPIVQNFYGSVLLIEGDFKYSAVYFHRALRTLLQHGHGYYADRETLRSRLNTPRQNYSNLKVRTSENREILNGLSIYFRSHNRDILFSALKNRSGHVPDPPIFKKGGIIGLALESIGEALQYADFHPKIISYKRKSVHNIDEERLSINAVSQNLLTACILAHDRGCLQEALILVRRYPQSYWTIALENHVAISLFFLQDREYAVYINTSNRSLFPTQNSSASRFR